MSDKTSPAREREFEAIIFTQLGGSGDPFCVVVREKYVSSRDKDETKAVKYFFKEFGNQTHVSWKNVPVVRVQDLEDDGTKKLTL